MIELIFALVIIGIVLMTAPMLIRTAAKSGYVAAQQEGIHEAASRISMIMGYYWDENNTVSSSAENVIMTISSSSSTDSDLNGTLRRIGTPQESKRAFVGDMGNIYATTVPASLGSDSSDTVDDDIDDFNGDVNLTEIKFSTADYIEKEADVNIATSVVYISDIPVTGTAYSSATLSFNPNFTATGNSTHIKSITATLTSNSGIDELNKTIILHAFSCNIGGTGELEWRQP